MDAPEGAQLPPQVIGEGLRRAIFVSFDLCVKSFIKKKFSLKSINKKGFYIDKIKRPSLSIL